MEISKIITNQKFLIALLLVIVGVTARLMPHEANFAPVAAIALLSGVLFDRRLALIVPLTIMMISDAVIGFYSSMLFTWLAFMLIALFGSGFKKAKFLPRVFYGGIGAAVVFFVISNLGVWLASGMYSLTLSGLVNCFYMALPFFRATLASDIIYSGMLFGALAFIEQHYRLRRSASSLAAHQ